MSVPLPPTSITIATTVGVLLVGVAWLAQPKPSSELAVKSEPAASAVQVARPLQRPYIDVIDSDGNGVPDWQEALQKTDALSVPNESEAYQEPDTLTEQFALEFFEQYMRGEQYGAFGTSPEELVEESGTVLARQAQDQPITRSQVTVSQDTNVDSLARYGEQVAVIIATHSRTDTEQELTIVDRAIRLNDKSELEKLDPIITVYENILADTLVLTTPQTYVSEHLVLVNAYQAVLNDIKSMRNSFDDPMRALLRIQRYQDDVTGLNNALTGLYGKLIADGVSWGEGSPVFDLIEVR